MKNFSEMMKKAQEMQSQMADAQKRMEDVLVTASSGAGLVSVTMSAKGTLKSVSLDPSIFSAEDKDVIEDLIVAAHAAAKIKAEDAMAQEMKKITGGLNLPSGFDMPS